MYDAFAAFPLPQSMFPNLRSVSLYVNPLKFPSLRVLFGPTLREASVTLRNPRPSCMDEDESDHDDDPMECQAARGNAKMLDQLREGCPFLQNFVIRATPWYDSLGEAVSSTLGALHHLRAYSGEGIPISFEAFIHLSNLPALESLDARIEGSRLFDDPNPPAFDDPSTQGFPALRKLRVVSDIMIICTLALRATRSLCLRSVALESLSHSSRPQIGEVFSVLAEHPSRMNFEDVYVKVSAYGAPEAGTLDANDVLVDSTFEPLLQLQTLIALRVMMRCPFLITNHCLMRMARSWKKLQKLDLVMASPYKHYTPLATISGLTIFALVCPDLKKLGLAVDTRGEFWPSDCCRPLANESQSKLQALDVGYSRLEHPAPLAAFLSHIFPKLDAVTSHWTFTFDEEEDDEEDAGQPWTWEAVGSLVSDFVHVRTQERNWAAEHKQIMPPPMTLEEIIERIEA